MVRSLALAAPFCLAGLVGCIVHTHETPDSSLTSTTRATNATAPAASHDPHFRVAPSIHEACGLANGGHADIAEGTAVCLKTGALNDKRVRISGSRAEVDHARERLVGQGVDINRIVTAYADGPAYVEVVENTLGKPAERVP